jgi:hypothetical protein
MGPRAELDQTSLGEHLDLPRSLLVSGSVLLSPGTGVYQVTGEQFRL